MAEQYVYRVTSATARLRFGFIPATQNRPPDFYLELVVNARGTTRTGGWTNARLVTGPGFPTNKAFKFEATSPSGPVTQVLTPITAQQWTARYTGGTETVTIVAETNKLTVPVTGPLAIAAQKAMAEHKEKAKAAKTPVKKKSPAKKKVK